MLSVYEDLIRGTARVSEEVAVRDVDQIVKDMAKSRATREAVDAEIRSADRLVPEVKALGRC